MRSLFKRNKATLGLDVGSGFVKGVMVDHSAAEPVLTKIGYLPLVADAIVEGEIMDPALVVDTIRALIETMGVSARNVVTAVGGRDVIVKKIQMDRMPVDDARQVIRWEAEQHVPFDMEGVQLDFQILDPEEEGLHMNVLLVAAKRELVDQKVMLLSDAGLEPAIVDVDAFALHNAFEYNYPHADRGVVALVNIGHELSSILVVQDGAPVVTRDVPLGTRHLKEDLRRRHAVSPDEADAILAGQSPGADEFASLLAYRAEELAMGLERAAAFLSVDGTGARSLGAVYLSGGGVRIPRLAQAISDRLHVRVETANPLQRLRVEPGAAANFPTDELAPMLMLPIGLALRTPN